MKPLADPVCMPVYYVQNCSQCGVIVCQVGEGSDELFWGYKYWRILASAGASVNSLPIPNASENGLAVSFRGARPNASYRRQFSCEVLRRALSNRPVFWVGRRLLSDSQKRQFLSPRLLKKFKELSLGASGRSTAVREKSWSHRLSLDDLPRFECAIPELLLMRVDKMSMAVSLEARVRFSTTSS